MYKAEKFKIETLTDRKGEPIMKVIEGYKAEKFQVKTMFTMTKFKFNLSEVQTLSKFKTFEDYLLRKSFDFISPQITKTTEVKEAPSSSSMVNGFSWNPFSTTTPNLHELRVDTHSEHSGGPILTQGNIGTQKQDNTSSTMMGYATNKKTTKKTIHASIWLSKRHPLSLDSFFPLLHILSFSSKQIAKFKDYLIKYQLPKGSFPLKAKVPLFLTMKAAFSL